MTVSMTVALRIASIPRAIGLATFLWVAALAPGADNDLSVRAYTVLQKNCFACHGAAKTSGLDLRTSAAAMAGGAHGPAIIPSKPDESRLYRMVSLTVQPSMPPSGKLSDSDLATLREWISAGASFQGFEESTTALVERPITAEDRNYWAFQRPKRVEISQANAIDAFLHAAMRAKGLKPSPRADRRTLVRRAYLDVTGLPPTSEEVEAFVKDASADAWPKLVDKLLASPHYGERWARHWLDLVRYADSDGFEKDKPRQMWFYRDWIIKSLNEDKPYNVFIIEQIAADKLPATARNPPSSSWLTHGTIAP